MNKRNAQTPPEPNRLIICMGKDRNGEFVASGMFIPFDQKKGARFFIKLDDGTLAPDRDTWNQIREWDYVA